jgi:hypothetical protein
MRLQICRAGLSVAGGSSHGLNPILTVFGFAGAPRRSAGLCLMTLAMLVASAERAALAQGMYPPPGYSPYGYGGQYAQPYSPPAYAPPAYGQPRYSQPQPYGTQAYAQPQPYVLPYSYPPPPQSYSQPSYPQQAYPQQIYGQPGSQALNADQLEQLVAPIALYPDTLVAQMLAASTYPAQVADADRWLQAQGNASPYQIAGGADGQPWDPSVKALTAFPQVLAEMDRNQRWTTDLGNAYYNQPQDVLEAVQVMRQRAQAAGNLQSTPQEQVSYNQGAIELAPPNPQTVYVPQYDPWTAYGDPVQPYEGFSLVDEIGSFASSAIGPALQFGAGIAMAAFDHTPFGWLSWAVSWLGGEIFFNHSGYSTHSTTVADWGFRGGGMRAFEGRGGRGGYGMPGGGYGYRGPAQGFNREPEQRYGRPASESYGRSGMEAYNRGPAPISRQQSYNRPENRLAYGPSYYNGGGERNFSNGGERGYSGPAQSYRGSSMQAYRGSSESFGGGFGARSSQSFKEPSQSFREPKSGGGFHLFGSGGGGYKQPSFKEPKMSGGGRSFGGGGGHLFGGGGGGGHFFGGGGGGGHSSGGHSGGGGGHSGGGGKHH